MCSDIFVGQDPLGDGRLGFVRIFGAFGSPRSHKANQTQLIGQRLVVCFETLGQIP